jgi:hypothetical protein
LLLAAAAAAAAAAVLQVYLIGQGLSDLGTADGLQPLSSSNAARAIVSLDYAQQLARYSSQHGHLLAAGFWGALPDDELQVGRCDSRLCGGASCGLILATCGQQQQQQQQQLLLLHSGLRCLMMNCRWVVGRHDSGSHDRATAMDTCGYAAE